MRCSKGGESRTLGGVGDQLDDTLADIRALGGRVTPARRAVLTAILDGGEHHFTAAEVFAAVEHTRPRPDRATVYRTLDLLIELGLLKPLQLDGDATVYHRTDHRHGHLVCTQCGAIVEIPRATLAGVARSLRRDTGVTIDAERVAIAGTCADCAAPAKGTRDRASERPASLGS
jgi:Fur family ferric uptake transcriptional regulator